MTLQTQHTVNAPATLTDEQRQRVSDALENAQSVKALVGTMPASSAPGVNMRSSHRCRRCRRTAAGRARRCRRGTLGAEKALE